MSTFGLHQSEAAPALETLCQEMTLVVERYISTPRHLFYCVAVSTVIPVASLILKSRVGETLYKLLTLHHILALGILKKLLGQGILLYQCDQAHEEVFALRILLIRARIHLGL